MMPIMMALSIRRWHLSRPRGSDSVKILLTRILLIAVVALLWQASMGHAADTLITAVMSSDQPRYREAHQAFVRHLATHGYPASSVEIVLQAPNPDPISWSNVIRKFVAYQPDLIVAYGAPVATVALREGEGIPLVGVDLFTGNTPSPKMMGVSSHVPMATLLKMLESVRSSRHALKRVAVLYNGKEAGSLHQLQDLKTASSAFGCVITGINVSSSSSLDAALNSLGEGTDAVIVTESGIACHQFNKIISRLKGRALPVLTTMPDGAAKGALVSLEIDPEEQGQLAAGLAIRILQGNRSSTAPMLPPKKVDLVINMLVARELGLNIPFTALSNATRVIK